MIISVDEFLCYRPKIFIVTVAIRIIFSTTIRVIENYEEN